MSGSSNKEPWSNIYHCILGWTIEQPFAMKPCIQDGIYSSEFQIHPCSRSTWKLGLQSFPPHDCVHAVVILGGDIQSVYAEMFLRISIRRSELQTHSLFKTYTGTIKNNEKLKCSLGVTIEDMLSYIDKEVDWNDIYDKWTLKLEIGYTEDSRSSKTSLKRKRLLQIGTDLSKYFMNPKYSDLELKVESMQIPVHTAILEARCPNFLHNFCNINREIIGEHQYEVIFLFLLFLYCGDIEYLMDVRALPLGLQRFGKKVGMDEFEDLSQTEMLKTCTKVECEKKVFFSYLKVSQLKKSFVNKKNPWSPFEGTCLQLKLFAAPAPKSQKQVVIEIAMIKGNMPVHGVVRMLIKYDKSLLGPKEVASEPFGYCKSKRFLVKPNSPWKFTGFVLVGTLIDDLPLYEVNETITFETTIYVSLNKFSTKHVRKIKFKICSGNDLPSNSSSANVPRDAASKLSGDFLRLLNNPIILNRETNDLELKPSLETTESSFKVHKVILAARSCWFSSKIETLVKPSLEVTDCTANVLQQVLKEMYAGKAKINEKNNFELYKAAHKFKLDFLKHNCRNSLIKSAKNVNYINTLQLAIEYSDSYLSDAIIKKMKNKFAFIDYVDGFGTLEFHNPNVAALLREEFIKF